jgi:hypothetical protein
MAKVITKDVPRLFQPVGQVVVTEEVKLKDDMILVPDTVEKSWETPVLKVIAVGKECKYVKEGDYIVYPNGGPAGKIFFQGYQYLLVNEDAIAGIIDPDVVPEVLKKAKQDLSILTN